MVDYEAMDNKETFVPHHMRGAYQRYFDFGISPGSFGDAVIRGDRQAALDRADFINKHHIDSQIAWVKMNSQHTKKED